MTYYNADLDEGIKEEYYLNDEDDYQVLVDIVKENIEADCYGVEVEIYGNEEKSECIFNTRDTHSIRDKIEEEIIRDKLIENVHRYLICNLLREDANFRIRIRMFINYPYILLISYCTDTKMFTLKKVVSNAYIEHFENLNDMNWGDASFESLESLE
jgi:hypothetical protein